MASDTVEIRLTDREHQLVRAILKGRTNRETAEALGVTEQTVKNQLTVLFQKVGVRSRLELAVFALTHKLESDDS